MFELLTLFVFIWLMGKVIGLVLKLSWGTAKVVASVLMGIAVPVLVVCVLFVGGLALLVPVGLVALAFAIVKACV